MAIRVTELQEHVCDVCRLLNADTSIKLCGYCSLCDAYICGDDLNRWERRLKAWYKRKTEIGYRGISDYDKHVTVPEDEGVN